jgi:hypothetical protein
VGCGASLSLLNYVFHFDPCRWINQTADMLAVEIAAEELAAEDPNRKKKSRV